MATKTTYSKATLLDTLRFVLNVTAPTIAKGVIVRRPAMVGLAERLRLDTRAVRTMQRLRRTYGEGPLQLRAPIQSQVVVLAPDDVRTVLDQSPEPYALATRLKRSALNHFEPENALVSKGAEREERRQFNEDALDFPRPVHSFATALVNVVHKEAEQILMIAHLDGDLTWETFSAAWMRVVRTVVFGPTARNDVALTDMIDTLRSDANWAFFRPKRKILRERFLLRVKERLSYAEPGSLAAHVAAMQTTEVMAPHQQVPQWLFAFDPAGMTTFRALALLAAHPEQQAKARQEVAADTTERQHLPFLRACILESLRLWPTTPMILRETTHATHLNGMPLDEDTGVIIYAPFFHRDDETLDDAHQFAPDIWLGDSESRSPGFVPFSDGPGACPAQHLVQMLGSAMLAALIEKHEVRLTPANRLRADRPMPGTLNNYGLRFRLEPLAD